MLKKILIFLIILILLVLAGVFMVNKTASAASQTYENLTQACPSGIDGCKDSDGKLFTETKGGERYIRMQIAIPGITDSCTYKVEDINKKEVIKTCNYVSSNLPDYVKKFYNFAVGAIAILAVIMIMIAGLQWIFAAGNPTTITTARSNITSAISGLVLILFSYVLLYTINPNLVNLSLTKVDPIGRVEQGGIRCANLEDGAVILPQLDVSNPPKTEVHDGRFYRKDNGKEIALFCSEHIITDKNYNPNKPEEVKKCWGNACSMDPDNKTEGGICVNIALGNWSCIDSYWAGNLSWEDGSYPTKFGIIAVNKIIKEDRKNLAYYETGTKNESGVIDFTVPRNLEELRKMKDDIAGFVLYVEVQRNWAIDDGYAVDRNCNPISYIKNLKGDVVFKPKSIKWSTIDERKFVSFDEIENFYTCSLNIDSSFKPY